MFLPYVLAEPSTIRRAARLPDARPKFDRRRGGYTRISKKKRRASLWLFLLLASFFHSLQPGQSTLSSTTTLYTHTTSNHVFQGICHRRPKEVVSFHLCDAVARPMSSSIGWHIEILPGPTSRSSTSRARPWRTTMSRLPSPTAVSAV